MASIQPRYVTRFLATATAYTPPDNERMEAVASLDKLKSLFPKDIDPTAQPTMLYLAGNLAVGDVVNLNDDAMTLDDTIRTYRAFEMQQVNIEHNRNVVVGFIVKAGLSELGTDRIITEEEARAAGKPVNIAIILAVWKVVDQDLCAFLESADAPASPDKGKLSLSFEVGFDDYYVVVLPKDTTKLALATQMITPESDDFDRFDKMLRVNGGKGMYKDSRIARVIMGNIIPLGAGIVAVPAAAVKGLTTITENPHFTEVEVEKAATDQFGEVPPQPRDPIQSNEEEVYSEEETMATSSAFIKLSEGWQKRLAAMQAAAGGSPLVNGVTITLSDGRTISNVKVFDGQTLQLDKELSMSGVVITDMTPGVPMQADDQANEHPHKADVYPTTSPEQQARDAENKAKQEEAQRAAYTDAALNKVLADINTIVASVSTSNPTISSMNLSEIKQSLASVKTIEELPAVVANVALFADAISQASEKLAAERKTAEEAAQAAQAAVAEIQAKLEALTKTHNEMVAAQQAAAAEAKFSERMAAVESTFDLDDDIRSEIVDEVKACANDEAFVKWMTSAKKKMKGWMKKDKKDGEKKGDKKDDKEPDADEDDAKAAAKAALASAAANVVDAPVGHDFQATPSLVDQMKETFSKNISIAGIKVAELNKSAKKK